MSISGTVHAVGNTNPNIVPPAPDVWPAVLYVLQLLTDVQQAQARANIGAVSDDELNGLLSSASFDPATKMLSFSRKGMQDLNVPMLLDGVVRSVSLNTENNLVVEYTDGVTTVIPISGPSALAVQKVNGLLPDASGNVTVTLESIEGFASLMENLVPAIRKIAIDGVEKDLSSNISFETKAVKTEAQTLTDFEKNTARENIEAASVSDISSLRGLQLSADPANSMIYVKDANGVQLAELSIAFANNEGTTLVYNDVSKKLELRNDANELLSEIPVADFVSGIAKNAHWNGAEASKLEFKDVNGAVLFSVDFSMSNIAGLTYALANVDAKRLGGQLPAYYLDYTNFTNTPPPIDISGKVSKSGDTMHGMLSFREKGAYLEGYANGTGDLFIGGQINEQWDKDFGNVRYDSGEFEWKGQISCQDATKPNHAMTFGQFSGELNNVYDQISARANNRLSNLASDLSASEKQAIQGKIGISQEDISKGVTAYNWGNHANAGYLKIADLNGYATQTWVTSQISSKANTNGSNVSGTWSSLTSGDSNKLGGQLPAYYLNYENLTNKPAPIDVSGKANTNGSNVNGTWDNLTAGDSNKLGGKSAHFYADTKLSNLSNTLTQTEKSAIQDKLGLQNFDGATQFVVTTTNEQFITMTKKKTIVRVSSNHSAVRVNAIQSAGVVLKVIANSNIVVKIPNVVSQLSNGTIVSNGTEIALTANQMATFEYLDESSTFFVTKQSLIL